AEARLDRPAGIFEGVGDADLGAKFPAALKNAEDVARLLNLETRQRIEPFQDAFLALLPFIRWRHRLQRERCAVHRVGFAEKRLLAGDRAVIIKGSSPEHAAVRHHALTDLQNLFWMA